MRPLTSSSPERSIPISDHSCYVDPPSPTTVTKFLTVVFHDQMASKKASSKSVQWQDRFHSAVLSGCAKHEIQYFINIDICALSRGKGKTTTTTMRCLKPCAERFNHCIE